MYGLCSHLGHVTCTNIYTFFSPLPGGCTSNLNETGPVVSEEKSFENVDRQLAVIFGQGHQMTLTPRISKGLHLNTFSYQRAQWQQKVTFSTFSIQKHKEQNLTLP